MTNIDPRDLKQDQPLTLVSFALRTPTDFWTEFDRLTDERSKLVAKILDACPATLSTTLGGKRDTASNDTIALTVFPAGHPIGSVLPTGVLQVTRADMQAARSAVQNFDSWVDTKPGRFAALLTEKNVEARNEMLTSINDYTAALGELKGSTLQNLNETAALLEKYSVLGHRPRRPAEVLRARRAADKASEDNTNEDSYDPTIYWDQARQTGSNEKFWLIHDAKTTESIRAAANLGMCLVGIMSSLAVPDVATLTVTMPFASCVATAIVEGRWRAAEALQPDYVADGGVYKVSRRAFGEIEKATGGLADRIQTEWDRTTESGNALDSDVLQDLLSAATDLEQAYVDWKSFLTEYNAWQDDQAIEDGGEIEEGELE